MDNRIESYPSVKNIEIDFGEIEVGVTKIKSIKIINQCNTRQSYIVQRDALSNPLDCAFHTVEYTWTIMPCDSYVCDISFKPTLPNRKYTDYFYITDTYKCCYKILVQGLCTGPNITNSFNRIIFISENKDCKVQKRFKFINESCTIANFMFDIDTCQFPFKISEVSGCLKPSLSHCFIVSFEPPSDGIYKYYLPCLILNQDPIIIELYGICGDLNAKYIKAFKSKIELIEEIGKENYFRHYMRDVTTIVNSDPPLYSLSWNFLDFGQAETGPQNVGKRTPQTVCLTNNNQCDVFIIWEKDKLGTFSVRPQKATIRGNQSVIFEARFDPQNKKTFYCREIIGRIFRLPCCQYDTRTCEEIVMDVVPDYVSIRLIGHTYTHDSNDWMPQYEIPESVAMPACIPGFPVYTTFLIKNFCQEPLMFCLVPPSISNYSVKPMMGLISCKQKYQIIAVQLFAEALGNHAYVERWAIRLNGNPKNEIYITFQGCAEYVDLNFGAENVVGFDPVHVCCSETRTVPIRNVTRHSVKFEYLHMNFPKELSVATTSGVVHPNEIVFQDWTFTPDELKNYDYEISCRLSAEIGGRSRARQIHVTASGMEGSLIAVPEELRVGELAYNRPSEVEFKAFNFSTVKIHFLLICQPLKNLDIMENPENDVEFSPKCGTVCPGKGERILLNIHPKQPGFYELNVNYHIRASSTSNNIPPFFKPKLLCSLNFMCHLPTLQIKDLLYNAETNKMISKVSLWKSLNIDDLNSTAKNLLPCQEASINMTIPLFALNENERLIIKLLLVNPSPIEASWTFKRQKTCFCKDKNVKKKLPVNIDFKTGCLFCFPDDSCTINPKKSRLKMNEKDIITIEIKGDTLKPSGINWKLFIEEERCIVLNLVLYKCTMLSSLCIKFSNVFIGHCTNLHYQFIWVYNAEECECTYMVDTENIAEINKENKIIVFDCLNPKGSIRAYDRQPVLFGFCPNRLGKFEVNVIIKVGEREECLSIEGDCVPLPMQMFIDNEKCPVSDIFTTSDILAYFNNDHVTMSKIPTHGSTTKLIMLHNHHQQNILHYAWKNYEIAGVVKIDIEPASGLIQPQSLLTFLVQVTAGAYAGSFVIDIFCDLEDVSERRLAEKKIWEHEELVKRLKDEFTITEKGFFPAEIPVLEDIKKPTTICKTLVVKVIFYDHQYEDQNADVTHQLKRAPSRDILQEKSPTTTELSFNVFEMSNTIFECIIWDILHSKYFAQALETLGRVQKLKYTDLPVNILDRIEQTERIERTIPKQYVADILRTMICMIVHEEFNLDTIHFSQPSDIRQISYQKVYMEAHNKQIFDKTVKNFRHSK